MRITFLVSQTSALREGINAPSSTVTLDIDPADFSPDDRALLADSLRDGHIADRPVEGCQRLYLVSPDLAGLRDAINEIQTERLRQKQINESQHAEAVERIRQTLATPPRKETVTVGLTHDGERTELSMPFVSASGEFDVLPELRFAEVAELQEEIEAYRGQRKSQIEEAKESLLPAARERLRKILEKEAREKETYDRLYARLPETLRARHAAGYAEDDEISASLQRLLIEDAGLRAPGDYDREYRITALTDDQFLRLEEIKKKSPEGATYEPLRVCDECPACKDTDPTCDECEGNNYNECMIVRIEWQHGGIAVTAEMPLE